LSAGQLVGGTTNAPAASARCLKRLMQPQQRLDYVSALECC
jgi:hypothetical protein